MKIAKADLVPKDTNLLAEYASFAELEAACEVFCEHVNTRVHRVTRRPPVEMLGEEQARLHPVPADPYTVAFGLTRTVPASMPMVSYEAGQYSVPHTLLGATVWVRVHGRGADEQVIIVHLGPTGPRGPSRSPDTGVPPRAAPNWLMSTSRPHPLGHSSAGRGRRAPPMRSSSPWARAPTCG